MRARLPALLVVLLALSGCFARDEPPPEPAWRAADGDAPVAAVAVVADPPAPANASEDAAPQGMAGNATASPTAEGPSEPANATAATTADSPSGEPSNATAAQDAPTTNATAANATAGNATTPANTAGNATSGANATGAGVVLLRTTHTFANGGLLGAGAQERPFDVPEGHARLVVNLTFARKGDASLLDREASVGLAMPNGTAAAPPVRARPGTSTNVTAQAIPGEWTLQYEGRAAVEATIVVTAFT